jgi:hypothetical protein
VPPTPPIPAQRKLEPLSPDRFGVHFTADAEFRELLEEVRALASHREPDGNLLRLMKRGLEAHNLHAARLFFGAGFIRKKQGRAPATESAAALLVPRGG